MQQFLENPSNVILLIVVLLLVIATAICFNLYNKLDDKNKIIEENDKLIKENHKLIDENHTLIEKNQYLQKLHHKDHDEIIRHNVYPLEGFKPCLQDGKEVSFVNMRYNKETKKIELTARRKNPKSSRMEEFDVFLVKDPNV